MLLAQFLLVPKHIFDASHQRPHQIMGYRPINQASLFL